MIASFDHSPAAIPCCLGDFSAHLRHAQPAVSTHRADCTLASSSADGPAQATTEDRFDDHSHPSTMDRATNLKTAQQYRVLLEDGSRPPSIQTQAFGEADQRASPPTEAGDLATQPTSKDFVAAILKWNFINTGNWRA